MDYKPGGQAIALGELGLSRFAAAQGAALGQQLRPCGTVDGAVHATAAQQALLGGVDDGVHFHGGDIISHNMQGHGATSLVSIQSKFHMIVPVNQDVLCVMFPAGFQRLGVVPEQSLQGAV